MQDSLPNFLLLNTKQLADCIVCGLITQFEKLGKYFWNSSYAKWAKW